MRDHSAFVYRIDYLYTTSHLRSGSVLYMMLKPSLFAQHVAVTWYFKLSANLATNLEYLLFGSRDRYRE